MAATTTSSSSSFLAFRGVAEDLAAARRAGPWTPLVNIRRRRRTARGFLQVALAASAPSRHDTRIVSGKKKASRVETGMPIPLAFDPLGDAGGLYLWGKEEPAVQTTRRLHGDDLPPVSAERLDRWIRSSVTEIVKRVEEAPFLSFIFADNTASCSSSSSSGVRIEREVAGPDDWPSVQKRWGSSAPDGVILVEELKDQEENEDKEAAAKAISGGGGGGITGALSSAATRTWGVLVQGRGGGADCTACYILNTCRVRSALGCCTHFCLVRAQCSGDSAERQLRDAWLAYSHRRWQQQ